MKRSFVAGLVLCASTAQAINNFEYAQKKGKGPKKNDTDVFEDQVLGLIEVEEPLPHDNADNQRSLDLNKKAKRLNEIKDGLDRKHKKGKHKRGSDDEGKGERRGRFAQVS